MISIKSGLIVDDEPIYRSWLSIDGTMSANSDSLVSSQKAVVTYVTASVSGAVAGVLNDRGQYNPNVTNLWPVTGGRGIGGLPIKGDVWEASASGTMNGTNIEIGWWFRALVDTPGQSASNWAISVSQITSSDVTNALGYTPYNATNPSGYITSAALTGLVPYTGGTSNVYLGAHTITSAGFIKSGGTSAQFLKADGSIDSNTYLPTISGIASYQISVNGNEFAQAVSIQGSGTFFTPSYNLDVAQATSGAISARFGSTVNSTIALGTIGSSGTNGLIWGRANEISIASNLYLNNGTYTSPDASQVISVYQQQTGVHVWYSAPVGTASSWYNYQRMYLNTAGKLGIGLNHSPTYMLDVLGGDIGVASVGNTVRFKTGTNGKIGTGTLVAGTVTISNTSITANSMIKVQPTSVNANSGILAITTKTASTSFEVTSSNASDNNTFDYIIFEQY